MQIFLTHNFSFLIKSITFAANLRKKKRENKASAERP